MSDCSIVKLEIKGIYTNKHIVKVEVDHKHDGMADYELIRLYKNKLLKQFINEFTVTVNFNGFTETWRLEDGTRD